MGPAASQTQGYNLKDASDLGPRRMVTLRVGGKVVNPIRSNPSPELNSPSHSIRFSILLETGPKFEKRAAALG